MKIIIIILQAILNLVRKGRDLIANTDKIPPAIKKSIIAWYSPKKQKLTNYDVIESYIIDFTTFNNRNDATINNNKFVFTGNVVVGINYERIQVEGIIMGYTCNSTTECTVTQLPTSSSYGNS